MFTERALAAEGGASLAPRVDEEERAERAGEEGPVGVGEEDVRALRPVEGEGGAGRQPPLLSDVRRPVKETHAPAVAAAIVC